MFDVTPIDPTPSVEEPVSGDLLDFTLYLDDDSNGDEGGTTEEDSDDDLEEDDGSGGGARSGSC